MQASKGRIFIKSAAYRLYITILWLSCLDHTLDRFWETRERLDEDPVGNRSVIFEVFRPRSKKWSSGKKTGPATSTMLFFGFSEGWGKAWACPEAGHGARKNRVTE